MDVRRFFRELQRRKVYRVAAAYIVAAWVVIQVVTQTFPFLDIPDWTVRLVIVGVCAGFPLAMVLSWLFDMTPAGIQRTDDLPARTPEAIPEKSVAVLPFENLSDDPQNAYFADGMHDDILTNLARVADLKVISRTSVQQFRTGARNLRLIAESLGVAHILEGTVRRAGNRVRVNAQLINARTEAQVWGESFDRELTDLFKLQSELAENITLALRARISPRERANIQQSPTADLGAYELYLRARDIFHWSGVGDAQESSDRALPLLERAIERDPRFALAHALISRIHAEVFWFGCDKRPARLEQARQAAETSLQLQPGLGEGHLARGFYHYYSARDYGRALQELDPALRATPNDAEVVGALGIIARRQGRWNESVAQLERASSLDPRNLASLWNLLETLIFVKRYDDAQEVIDQALAIFPQAHFLALVGAGIALRRDGLTGPFCEVLKKIPAGFDPGGAVTSIAVRVALMERDYDRAEARLNASSDNWCNDTGLSGLAGALDGYTIPRAWYRGLIARGRGAEAAAREAFAAARDEVAEDLAKWPEDEKTMVMLGLILAALGDNEEAVRLGERAAALLPPGLDAIDGPLVATNFAVILLQAGEKKRALALLESLHRLPGGPTSGFLRAEREWDPLRNEPAFQKLCAAG